MPKYAVILDKEEKYSFVGYAPRHSDGLYYIGIDESAPQSKDIKFSGADRAIVHSAIERAMKCTSNITTVYNDAFFEPQISTQQAEEHSCYKASSSVDDLAKYWHERLGHVYEVTRVKSWVRDGILPHIVPFNPDCKGCMQGKFRRQHSLREIEI